MNYPGVFGRWHRFNPRHSTLIDLERAIYNDPAVRRVVVQSSVDAELLEDVYGVSPQKQQLVPNGVDLSVFHEGAREHRLSLRSEQGLSVTEPLLVIA